MSDETKITLFKDGPEEKTIPISQITVPNLWHIIEAIHKRGRVADGPGCAKMIHECWSLAHGLKLHIQEGKD